MSIPYVPEPSSRRFYVPSTLASDFDNFLNTDIPNQVMDFTIYKNWYEQNTENYVSHTIRGEIYPDTSKSRYSNTDNHLNFRTSLKSGIQKGDMLTDDKDNVYILDWEVALESNNASSRCLKCNSLVEIKEYVSEVVDNRGYLIAPEGWQTVCSSIPANIYRYDGRPEYSATAGNPGVVPNALTIVTIQYNDSTKNIKIDDTFVWGNETYKIVDVNYLGVSLDKTHGILTLQAMKAAGGNI